MQAATKPAYLFSVIVFLTMWLGACAGSTSFRAYPQQVNPLLTSINQGQTPELSDSPRGFWHKNTLLSYLEQGRMAQITGQDDISRMNYAWAIAHFRDADDAAIIQLSAAGEQAGALMLNDNVLKYQGEEYERGFLHLYQAFNYLYLGDLEGAGVEIRRLNAVQRKALEKFEQAQQKYNEETRHRAQAEELASSTVFSDMDELAQTIEFSFLNAFAFYAAAVIYELRGEYNDAYIDYQKALNLAPQNLTVARDALRLARQLGFRDDARTLEATYTLNEDAADRQAAELIVFYEHDFVPYKEEVYLPILNYGGRFTSIAFPVYQHFKSAIEPLIISRDSAQTITTEAITDVQVLAAKALREKRTGTIVRQIGRVFAKAELHHQLEKNAGIVGSVASTVYNVISEHADLRSWLSLPNQIHIARMPLPEGKHHVTLRDPVSGANETISVDLLSKQRVVLHVINTGSRLYVRNTQF